MSPYLAWFDEIPDEELAHAAGGKGASLCRMSRAGLPVPKGFIVRSEMFNAFMEANGLWDYVFEKLDTIDFSSDASLISVAAEIRERIISSPVPQQMAEDIIRFYSQIGDSRQPRWPSAPAVPPRIWTTPALPGSRRPSCSSSAMTTW